MKNVLLVFTCLLSVTLAGNAQEKYIPASYGDIHYDETGHLYLAQDGERFYSDTTRPRYTIAQLLGNPVGTEEGIRFDFGDLEGRLTYGFIPYQQASHPAPVYRFTKPLRDGKVKINIAKDFRSPYDFVDWQGRGQFTIGYRLTTSDGTILFDGEVAVEGTGPFQVAPTIYEGPFISNLTPGGAVVWFKTDRAVESAVTINGKQYQVDDPVRHHQYTVSDLKPNTGYEYTVQVGGFTQTYSFRTFPEVGSREAFVFGYTSDSRNATGGGERNIYGTNAYIMKKMAALAYQQGASFVQFTGDMISGYLHTREEQLVQYTNWKKSIEPFWHYIPFYTGMGNHEALGHIFRDENGRWKTFIDKFPYKTESSEAVFGESFVNPVNGPVSEDNTIYDPDTTSVDFPPYAENVYYYIHGNIAMIVLNSDYWYAPTVIRNPDIGGGLHGYLMDGQLQWLKTVIDRLERDQAIDHIFVTHHTPVFPNGGHTGDDMWYHGDNSKRPYISGKPVKKGIIERRDEYLDILINQSSKVLAVLTGDEHNYNWLKLTREVPIYPEDYPHPKLNITRPIYQINNGAAGAPYYGQEEVPWSRFTRSFSVENALCLFRIQGDRVTMKVVNPDALNIIDEVVLRE